MVHKVILCGGVMFLLLVSRNIIGEISTIINLKSAVLVLGGTLMCAFLAFPMKTINVFVIGSIVLCERFEASDKLFDGFHGKC